MTKSGRIFLLLAVLLTLASCNRRPDGVLGEDEMTDLMVDMELADAYYNTAAVHNVSKQVLVESVLAKHGVTHAQLDSTLEYYGRNMDDYYALYEKVERKLRIANNNGQENLNEELNDIWPYNRFAALFKGQTSDGIIFSIPADEIDPGSALEWGMRLSNAEGAELMLGVEYENGASTYLKKNSGGNRSLNISLQTDTGMTAKRIYGVMTVPQTALPIWADSIRLVKSDYDSLSYSKIRSQRKANLPVAKPLPKTEDEKADSVSVNSQRQ